MASLDHLEDFVALNRFVALYTPPADYAASLDTTATPQAASPDLVIFMAWMSAAPKHIAKYTKTYKALYPHARILVIRSGAMHMVLYSDGAQRKELSSAIDVIRAAYDQSKEQQQKKSHPRILLHVASNGGCQQATQLARVWRAS